jgi:hypothetical protein
MIFLSAIRKRISSVDCRFVRMFVHGRFSNLGILSMSGC